MIELKKPAIILTCKIPPDGQTFGQKNCLAVALYESEFYFDIFKKKKAKMKEK